MPLTPRLLLRTIATFTVAMSFMALMLASLQAVAYVTDAQGRIGHYQYDPNGNRTVAEDSGDGSSTSSSTASYDDQDRLVSVVEAGSSRQYTYRASGELQQISEGGVSTSSQYTYDDFGNLKQVTLADGRLIDYVVDGRNRRIGKRVNGALVQGFLYQDQLKPIAELDGAGNLVATYIYADNINVPEYLEKGGNRYRLVTDQLGSVRLVINSATGEVAQRIDYDAWGKVTSDSNPGFQPFGFAGGLYDRDTGFTRFGARDYDARIGRWTAKDPIGFAGGDTGLYNYAGNDPVNFVDPDGETPITIGIGAVLGAIAGGIQAKNSGGNLLAGIGTGALAGAAAGFVPLSLGVFANAALNGIIAGSGNAANQLLGDDCFNLSQVATQALYGAIGGAIGLGATFSAARSFLRVNRTSASSLEAATAAGRIAANNGEIAGAYAGQNAQNSLNLATSTNLGGFNPGGNSDCSCRK